ncbi:hypothetical protein MMC27_001381 [Xylographa pallens]|nr:hypothetical protein [Xylographa pallens]
MNVFPQRSQDGTFISWTPQGASRASTPSTRASTIHGQSTGSLLDPGGVVLPGQSVGSNEQTTEDMGDGSTPTESRNSGSPFGFPVLNGIGPYDTQDTVPVNREGYLVDGFSNNGQSSEEARVAGQYNAAPQQTLTSTSATPAITSVDNDQAAGIPPGLLVSSLEDTGFPRYPNGESTVLDSQRSRPPVTQPYRGQRRRRRFIDWLRRHRSHRHGPWAPFIRRNWNAVSDAIRDVEILGFGSSRGPAVDPVLRMDQE